MPWDQLDRDVRKKFSSQNSSLKTFTRAWKNIKPFENIKLILEYQSYIKQLKRKENLLSDYIILLTLWLH